MTNMMSDVKVTINVDDTNDRSVCGYFHFHVVCRIWVSFMIKVSMPYCVFY